jgi:membrane-associated phospholipid phosphatase
MNSIDRKNLLPTLSRTSPVLFLILLLFNCILSPSYGAFYLFVIYVLVVLSNWVIKHFMVKPLYKLFNKTRLPILGMGTRPSGAASCQFTLDNISATSFGMPSGHSQIAWTVATYMIARLINNWKNANKDNKAITSFGYIWLILSCLLVLAGALYISYSRVYIEGCHTFEQVTVGGLLGILCGFLIYYFESDAIYLLSKIY